MVGSQIIYVACHLEPDHRRTKDHSGADLAALSKSDGLVSPPFNAPLHVSPLVCPTAHSASAPTSLGGATPNPKRIVRLTLRSGSATAIACRS